MAIGDKEFKKKFLEEISGEPDKYFATTVLRKEGYERKKCSCGKYFWTTIHDRANCDEPACSGGFRFFTDNPAREPLSYAGVWKRFRSVMEKRGYTSIHRYPVIARWRDDTDFVQASIYNFQPYVVSGEIEPPANPLIVPQFCLRFNDIDNVGVTMSHMTGFIMIGQHAFYSEQLWDQDKAFSDILAWLTEGLGLSKNEITFHEDAWAGGGNFGPCMEFFSRGCELGNQVYMLYEQVNGGRKDLSIKVLDMGMGQDRVCWFTQGKGTIYDAVFPGVMSRLYERTGIHVDEKFLNKYILRSAFLNMDETEDLDKEWLLLAKEFSEEVEEFKSRVLRLAALYSIAEHTRSLLVALGDGGLPSNVGGGYNLRVILRRSLGFIKQYEWSVSLHELVDWHLEELESMYPELREHIDDVHKILEHEIRKYEESVKRNKGLIEKLVKKGGLSIEVLLEQYDSNGINPYEVAALAKKLGYKVDVPDNFYAMLATRHEDSESKTQTTKEKEIDVGEVTATEALYFDHYDNVEFESQVLNIIDGRFVILNRTAFYPTSGGQLHDKGVLNGVEVVGVNKQTSANGIIIIHELAKGVDWKTGMSVRGNVDFDARLQLSQHHTATHILTGSARAVLGNHVWQAGAAKTLEKGRLDITHFEQLSASDIAAIELMANNLVDENRPVYSSFMPRDVAESKYGFRLYQGGAVPGKSLRIIEIPDFDVEACGGTHLHTTGELGHIKILRTTKIQDGVVRMEFVAGAAADMLVQREESMLSEARRILGGTNSTLPSRAMELFEAWKASKKGKLDTFELNSTVECEGDVIGELARVLKTQPEHVMKTLKRFREEIEKNLKAKK